MTLRVPLISLRPLGSGSILNYGAWSRGYAADYDTWLNPYRLQAAEFFRRSERFDAGVTTPPDRSQPGRSGQ